MAFADSHEACLQPIEAHCPVREDAPRSVLLVCPTTSSVSWALPARRRRTC